MNTKNNYQTKAKSQEETDDENDFPIRTYGKGELAARCATTNSRQPL